jgi:transcriptional regulator with XRE-family HTH domain
MEEVNLALNIKERRKFKQLSQAKLAERAEISTQMVKDIEAGRRNPSTATLDKICKALGITHQALYSSQIFVDQTLNKGKRIGDLLKRASEIAEYIPEDVYDMAERLGPHHEVWGEIRLLMANHLKDDTE